MAALTLSAAVLAVVSGAPVPRSAASVTPSAPPLGGASVASSSARRSRRRASMPPMTGMLLLGCGVRKRGYG